MPNNTNTIAITMQILQLVNRNKSPRISNNSILKNNNTCLQHCWSPTPNNRPKITECRKEVTNMFENKQGLSPIEYCQQNPNKDDQICYRLLRYHEDPTKGLVAKKPNNTTCSILNHVNDGSKLNFQGSPFISITKNLRWVLWYGMKRMIEETIKMSNQTIIKNALLKLIYLNLEILLV